METTPPATLSPALQTYGWGDPDFIPDLLNLPKDGRPIAEAWFGAHPSAPSLIKSPGGEQSLADAIATEPARLGSRVNEEFGQLPFLAKILAASCPLSIQVHPPKLRAKTNFASGADGYRDANHKPEMMLAMTPFYALCGFRPYGEIEGAFEDSAPELRSLLPKLGPNPRSLRSFVRAYYELPEKVRTTALLAWLARIDDAAAKEPETPAHWALRAHREFSSEGGADPGLAFFLLLNLVRLERGEALFVHSGLIHAYLEGAGVEVMANSDNVIRGGLTQKLVDVPELLEASVFEPTKPWRLQPETVQFGGGTERVYAPPVREFELSMIEPGIAPVSSRSDGPEVLITLEGSAELDTGGAAPLSLPRGAAAFVADASRYRLSGAPGSLLACVRVPDPTPSFRGRQPTQLRFGTSGLRGLVEDFTDLEAYINTRGFLGFAVESGDAPAGSKVVVGGDLRPSTDGESHSILRAVARAATDAGFEVVNAGRLPTPALAYYATEHGFASIMVTGSHIPFDRNGIKFNKPGGEVLKADEPAILGRVNEFRSLEYGRSCDASMFGDDGMFLEPAVALPPVDDAAIEFYKRRYTDYFGSRSLSGLRIAVYQHSAVGRDLLVDILRELGATVFPFGRSSTFVAIDTEAFTDDQRRHIENELRALVETTGPVDGVVSTDGDSDRPLVLGTGPGGELEFFSGDRLGIVTALELRATQVVVPISSTDAVEAALASPDRPSEVDVHRTKIGSPHVIARLNQIGGARKVAWEANGGFIVGSALEDGDKALSTLGTRDAVLPIVCALTAAKRLATGAARPRLQDVSDRLPARFSHAALLDGVEPAISRAALGLLELSQPATAISFRRSGDLDDPAAAVSGAAHPGLHAKLADAFGAIDAGRPTGVNYLDGVRITFETGEILHLRPSGNAPQLRVYAIADSPSRAEAMTASALGDVLPRLLEKAEQRLETRAILGNIELAERLFSQGEAAKLIAYVSGSSAARDFWQARLEAAQSRLGAEHSISLEEDLPVNQAFGLLLAWQRLRESVTPERGSLVAFVFGEGSRAAPFTETENGQKPAILSYVRNNEPGDEPYLPMVELAIRHFAPVEAFLRRSGFSGLVVKWGDEVQVPSLDLAGVDPGIAGADVVRFVDVREITDAEARSKDWVGFDDDRSITSFVPRRPIAEMHALADQGILQKRDGQLFGGINLGSIAVSYALLDALLEEFSAEINDPSGSRRDRPDLDPQFFTAMTIAQEPDDTRRENAWSAAQAESSAMAALADMHRGLVERLRKVFSRFEAKHDRRVKMVALDFGNVYWGDIGQHSQLGDYYLALCSGGRDGEIARALAGFDQAPDARGNVIIASSIPPGSKVTNSVLVGCEIREHAEIDGSVLLDVSAASVTSRHAFAVDSTARSFTLAPRSGCYRVVEDGAVDAPACRHLTTAFLDGAPVHLAVDESTDLRDRAANYDRPILGNAISFNEAHERSVKGDPETAARARAAARALVSKSLREKL